MAQFVEPSRPDAAALAARLEACDSQIAEAEKAARRHGLFALLGVSPASLVPMIGLGIDFGAMALLGASVVVGGLETWRWIRASSELRTAEAERERLLGELRGGDA